MWVDFYFVCRVLGVVFMVATLIEQRFPAVRGRAARMRCSLCAFFMFLLTHQCFDRPTSTIQYHYHCADVGLAFIQWFWEGQRQEMKMSVAFANSRIKELFNCKTRMPGTVKYRPTVAYWVQIDGINIATELITRYYLNETLIQCCFNARPTSATLAQRWTNIE